jgi:hypothetical protein
VWPTRILSRAARPISKESVLNASISTTSSLLAARGTAADVLEFARIERQVPDDEAFVELERFIRG